MTQVHVAGCGARPRVRLRGGLLSPRLLRSPAGTARVALVATGATLLGGDRVSLDLRVGDGATLELVDVAGTVAYDGRGAPAHWDVSVAVGAGSTLVWHGEPLVVAEGARVERTMHVQVEQAGRLLLRDRVALGRTGERPGEIDCRTRMTLAGQPALVEDLTLDAESCLLPGMLAGARVVDTVTALGWRPAQTVPAGATAPGATAPGPTTAGATAPGPAGPACFSLAATGAYARELVDQAHRSRLSGIWDAWRGELRAAGD